MITAHLRVPQPTNEPVKGYAPGSPERAELKSQVSRFTAEQTEIPLLIGGKEVRTGTKGEVRMPHRHSHVLATVHQAGEKEIAQAIDAALKAKGEWAAMSFEDRAAVFLRAAELLATKYRPILNASTMLGQSKTAHQAEIDAACEAIDFLRFNVHFAEEILHNQPQSAPGMWNQTDYRPLDGFVFAVAPFNFTSIALNLCTAPALMGNTVVFKAAETSMFSAWQIMRLLREAGLPDGVINFLPGKGSKLGPQVLKHPDLGGVHFTGSTGTFQGMWKSVGEAIHTYHQYPRLVGETGGKDFIFIHPSAADDLDALAVAIARGGYEYQGQKCSACSRVFVPKSVWPKLKDKLVPMIEGITQGDVADFRNFMGRRRDGSSARRWCSATAPPTRSCPRRSSPRSSACTSTTTRSTWRRSRCATRPRATRSPGRSSPATARPSPPRATSCATPRATSTSTTSPPAPWSASSPSAAAAPRAPTTRPARR